MTKTVQIHSSISLNEAGKNLIKDKPETENNMSLMLSFCDNINRLCENLNKLSYVIQKKKQEIAENNNEIYKIQT